MASYFSILPKEINSKIFSYLPLNTIIRSLARSSKATANLIQATLSDGLAAPNSLNILVTGLPGAGSTTLYSRLKDELDFSVRIKNLSIAKEATTPPLKLVNDNTYQINGIQLQNIRANIWHGSTRKNQVKMMYANCGACQAIIYVVTCGDIEQFKAKLRQDLVTYHALTSDVEWIFVINKMDLVQYSEQEYTKCVDSIKKVAVKVIGAHRLDRMHFIPMSIQDMSTPMTSDANTNMTWYNTGMGLWSALNHVANEPAAPSINKLFTKFNASIVKHFPNLSKKGLHVVGVYIIDGCVSVGDNIQVFPTGVNKLPVIEPLFGYFGYYDRKNFVPAQVIEIQSNHNSRSMALSNSYVTLALSVQCPPLRKYHFVRYPSTVITKEYFYTGQFNKLFHAVLLNVGDILPEYKWSGLITEGYNGAIHSLGIRASITVAKILTVWDKNGNELDIKTLKEERKCFGIMKGEKAEVILQPLAPVTTLNLTTRNPDYTDACGRFVIMNQKWHVVAVGSIDRGIEHTRLDTIYPDKSSNNNNNNI